MFFNKNTKLLKPIWLFRINKNEKLASSYEN